MVEASGLAGHVEEYREAVQTKLSIRPYRITELQGHLRPADPDFSFKTMPVRLLKTCEGDKGESINTLWEWWSLSHTMLKFAENFYHTPYMFPCYDT